MITFLQTNTADTKVQHNENMTIPNNAPIVLSARSAYFNKNQRADSFEESELLKLSKQTALAKYSTANPEFKLLYDAQGFDASHSKIFNSMSEKEIERIDKRGLLSNDFGRDKKFSAYSISQLVTLNDEEWKKVIDRNLLLNPERPKQFHGDDIVALAKIPDEQWDLIKKRNLINIPERKKQFGGNDLVRLSSLNDDKWQRVTDNSLLYRQERGYQFYGLEIVALANLSDKIWDKIKDKSLLNIEGREKQFSADEIISFLSTDDKTWQRIDNNSLLYSQERKNNQLDVSEILKLASLKDSQWDRVSDKLLKLTDSNFFLNGSQILELASLDDDSWQNVVDSNAFEDIKKRTRLSFSCLKNIANVDNLIQKKGSFKRFKKIGLSDYSILQKLLPKMDFVTLSGYDNSKLKRIKDYSLYEIKGRDEQLWPCVLKKLLNSDEKHWQRLIDSKLLYDENRKKQFPQLELPNILEFKDSVWDSVVERNLLNPEKNYSTKDIVKMLDLNDEEWNYLKKFESLNLDCDSLLAILRLCYHDNMSFDKDDFSSNFSFVKNCECDKKLLDNPDIKKAYKIISQNLAVNQVKKSIPKEKIDSFFQNVIANKPEIENKIRNLDISRYEKDGLPLAYPREKFIADLNSLTKNYSPAMKKNIFNELNIKPVYDELQDNIIGYNGFLSLPESKSVYSNGIFVKDEIYSITDAFLNKNRVVSDDKNLNEIVSSILGLYPDFINLIGKQQNPIHGYSLDVHILSVFQNALKNPEYNTLSDLDKTSLKLAALFHDIGKSEFVVDDSHPQKSTFLLNEVLNSINLSLSLKNRVLGLVKNHHWFTFYNNSISSKEEVAATFMSKSDFNLAKMLTYADMSSVNVGFKEMYEDNTDKIYKVEKAFNQLDSSGNFLFTSRIADKSKIPTQTYNNKQYKVLKCADYSEDEDFGKFGFVPGTKKQDLRFLVHAIQKDENMKLTADTISCIASPVNQAALSASYISCENRDFFMDREDGLILSCENQNVASAYDEDQHSGFLKDDNAFKNIVMEEKVYRNYLSNRLCSALNISKDEYAELYRQFEHKKHLSQIKDSDVFKLASREISGKELRKCIHLAEDFLLTASDTNEVVVKNPKIEAVISKHYFLNTIPKEMLDYAEENDLPIILI